MSGHVKVLQEHQARLAERRAELRGRVVAAAAGELVSGEQLGRWLDEIQELSERIGIFHAKISEARETGRQAENIRAAFAEFAIRDTFESAELAVPA